MVFQEPNIYFKSIQGIPLIWITIINKGYINYTRNFLRSMEIHGISFTLIVYCLDKDTMNNLEPYKNVVCLDASYFIKGTLDPSFSQWGMISYKSLVFSKLDALKYSLNLCKKYNIHLLSYIDTDIIVLKDPTPIILAAFNEHFNMDIIHQCDETIQICSNSSYCPAMSTGVIALRTSKLPDSIFEYCSDNIIDNMSDQHYLIHRIDEVGIQRMSINKYIFLNGIFPNLTTPNFLILPESASLIHFNCMIGNEKEESMKLKGMWFI